MEILEDIRRAVEKVTADEHEISPDTDLEKESILDSLDSVVFLLEMEKLYDIKLDDEIVDARNLYQVANLIDYIESETTG